jgi:hypothetical protein
MAAVFDPKTDRFLGYWWSTLASTYWRGVTTHYVASVGKTYAISDSTSVGVALTGGFGVGLTGTGNFTDSIAGTSGAITVKILGPPHGWDTEFIKRWDELDLAYVVTSSTGSPAFSIQYLTPSMGAAGTTFTPGTDLPTALSVPMSDATLSVNVEKRTTVGLNGYGRWIRPYITATGFGSTGFALQGYRVRGFQDVAEPAVA